VRWRRVPSLTSRTATVTSSAMVVALFCFAWWYEAKEY